MKRHVQLYILVCSIILSIPIISCAEYSFTTLPTPSNFGLYVTGVNDAGQIIGYYWDSAGSKHGFLLAKDTSGQYSLSLTTAPDVLFYAINNHGEILGEFNDGRDFLLSNGMFNPLPFPGNRGPVTGINDAGQIVGHFWDDAGTPHGFVLSKDSSGQYSLSPIVTPGVFFQDINNHGDILGQFNDGRSFLLSGGMFNVLPIPNGFYPSGVNDAGQIVGSFRDSGGTLHGFVLSKDSSGQYSLGPTITAPGALTTEASGINTAGQIVGRFWDGVNTRGFIAGGAALQVTAVNVAQVVYDPDINGDKVIDLVEGKEAVIIATIKATGISEEDLLQEMQLEVTLCSNPIDIAHQTPLSPLILSDYTSDGGGKVYIYFTPSASGSCDLVVTAKVLTLNMTSRDFTVKVKSKETWSPNLVYMSIIDCAGIIPGTAGDCYDSPFGTGETIANTNQFIKKTFPIGGDVNREIAPDYLGNPVPLVGLGLDLMKLEQIAARKLNGSKVVGLVSIGYFRYHSLFPVDLGGVSGISFGIPSRAVIAKSGEHLEATIAHELGHSYGLQHLYDNSINYPGPIVSGFDVAARQPIEPDGNPTTQDPITFMGNRYEPPHWIDKDSYAQLFDVFSLDRTDPPVMAVATMLHKDGSLDLHGWYFRSDGVADASMPGGNYSVRVLDSAGNILSEISRVVNFQINAHPLGFVPVDTVPVVFVVPYDETAATVQILREGQVIVSVPGTTRVLRDAIDSIPDIGFAGDPVQSRTDLHAEIDQIEFLLTAGKSTQAQQALRDSLLPHLESALVG